MSNTATIGDLTRRVKEKLLHPFLKKPTTLEATLRESAVEQGNLALYFDATKGDGINSQIYNPFYMPMEEPLVREIHESLTEGTEATFRGLYNTSLGSLKDARERLREGVLIRLEGELKISNKAYDVKFDVDRLHIPFGYFYDTRLVDIERKS